MLIIKYSVISIAVLGTIFILGFCIASKKPFKFLFFNFLISIAALIIIDLTSSFTGVHIPLNYYTVSLTSVFGIPAICLYLVMGLVLL